MATASLTNFTVPLSTSQSASSQGLLMPKLKFRFRVTFLNFGRDDDHDGDNDDEDFFLSDNDIGLLLITPKFA